jgi:hypothetical protein
MVKYGVLVEVRDEFLNIIKMTFSFKGLKNLITVIVSQLILQSVKQAFRCQIPSYRVLPKLYF